MFVVGFTNQWRKREGECLKKSRVKIEKRRTPVAVYITEGAGLQGGERNNERDLHMAMDTREWHELLHGTFLHGRPCTHDDVLDNI
jgi:putative sterol carrier protein